LKIVSQGNHFLTIGAEKHIMVMLNREAIIDYILRDKPFRGVERELEIRMVSGKITSIVGPRRSGKTYYLLYLLNNRFRDALYLNFENIFLKSISGEEFFEVIKIFTEVRGHHPKTLLLDEVQEVRGWETLLRTLLDYGYSIIITGSSSRLIGMELATQIRGRTIPYLLLPFSFREFLRVRGVEPPRYSTFEEEGRILGLLDQYLKIGGYPEIVLAEDDFTREKILRTYLDEIFLKDFVERHGIRSIELGRFLFEFIFQNYSNEISIKRIVDHLEQRTPLSKKTIYAYLDALRDTLGVFFLERYSPSVYVRKTWPRKVYIADVGLARPLQVSRDVGKKMENICFLELLRRTNLEPLLEIYYYRDYQNYEVDFIVKRGDLIRELIQVSYASGRDEVGRREFRGLVRAGERLGCRDMRVLTWDLEDTVSYRGYNIRLTPLWRWLLGTG